jgi:acyl-coenzyme A thioesterase PaaI-like protein
LYPIRNAGSKGMDEMAAAKLTVKELERLLSAEFPHLFNSPTGYVIEDVWFCGCRVRKLYGVRSLRPGGTIAGTTMMGLADFAIYTAILGTIGWVPLTVTTNLTINFLKKPAARDLLGEARLLKLGKRLAVGEIGIRSDGDDELVAHATATYSIPPQR